METKVTTNRKLENFLYALGISPIAYEVLWDGMVQWTYHNTQDFKNACDLFKQTKQRMFKEDRP